MAPYIRRTLLCWDWKGEYNQEWGEGPTCPTCGDYQEEWNVLETIKGDANARDENSQ